MVTEVVDTLSENGIPLPPWIIPTLISIIITIVVAISVYAFFKWNWGDGQ